MDTVISVCSIVIALGALALAVYEGRATRRHNLLSTKPHLSFGCGLKQDAPQVNLKVDNNGLGPAIVKAFDVRLHSKVLAPMP